MGAGVRRLLRVPSRRPGNAALALNSLGARRHRGPPWLNGTARAQGPLAGSGQPGTAFTDVLDSTLVPGEPSIGRAKTAPGRGPPRAAKGPWPVRRSLRDPAPVSGPSMRSPRVVVIARHHEVARTLRILCDGGRRPTREGCTKTGPGAQARGQDQPPARHQVVTDYLDAAHLTKPLNELGFPWSGMVHPCIGNSGPLDRRSRSLRWGASPCRRPVGHRNIEGRFIRMSGATGCLASSGVAYATPDRSS